ncbi:MAG: methyltransferase [Aromatoleum sp.]|nr:methyltransferase [Aromatoleum sp.]
MFTSGTSAPDASPEREMLRLTSGHLTAQALRVFASLGLPDILREGPKSAADLALATKSDATTLFRTLRFLATIDIVKRDENGEFSLTRLGRTLCKRPNPVIHDNTLLACSALHWTAIGNLLHAVKTGENAFRAIHGKAYFESLGENPEEAGIFNAAMNSASQIGIGAILAAYDFSAFRSVVDVAGGEGALLRGILARHKHVRGILFDATDAIEQQVPDEMVADRLTTIRGDFFSCVPPGADAYLLRRILHNWNDQEAITILRQCRGAMPRSSKLLIIELAAPQPGDSGFDWAFLDMLMMLINGGRERSLHEFEQILEAAGFSCPRVILTRSPYWILESAPA